MHGTAVYLSAGAALGLSAGLSPGPLLALTVSQAIAHGAREGMKVAFVPLLTDPPVILAAIFIIDRCSASDIILGTISIAGGAYLARIAYADFRARARGPAPDRRPPGSLRRGVTVNLLSPNPYIFWLTVGAPALLSGWRERPASAIAFASGFYACLVGAQAAAAAAAARAGRWAGGRGYRFVVRGLGVLIASYGLLLLLRGLRFLHILRW